MIFPDSFYLIVKTSMPKSEIIKFDSVRNSINW